MQPSYKLIYQSSGTLPLHMLNILCSAFGVGGLIMAAFMLQAPDPVMHSEATRWAWAGGIAAFALACPLGAWLYSRRVVRQILLSPDGSTLRVYESSLFSGEPRLVAVDDTSIHHVASGDAAGEETFSGSRFHVQVRGQRGFTVAFNQGARAQRDALVQVLAQS